MLRELGLLLIVSTMFGVTSARGQRLLPELTLVEKTRAAAAIARVTIVSDARVRAIDTTELNVRQKPSLVGRTFVVPVTEWDARVTEALKSTAPVFDGATISIGLPGGTVRYQGKEYSNEGPELRFVKGGTYLVFLTSNEALGMMTTAFYDVFRLDGERLEAVGGSARTPYGKEILQQDKETVIDTVRQAIAQ